MRDPSKPIPNLPTGEEQQGNYTRVQADLTDPASVAKAVKSTGATRAFIYFVFGTRDYMRASIEALRDNGVEFVVFLSSSSVGLHTSERDDVAELRAIPPEAIIPHQHGMVEAELADVFGREGAYVALRPGYFASNLFRLKDGIAKGEVRILAPQLTWDCIAPDDIGEIAGVVLARGRCGGASSGDGEGAASGNVVYLYGPRTRSMEEAIGVIGRALDRADEVRVTSISKEEMLEQFVQQKMPRSMAEYFVKVQSEDGGSGDDPDWRRPRNMEGVDNIRRYTGREGTRLEDWVERNKQGILA
jgi:uncharacterized protein YbjT (DUF2867 family)